MSQEIETLHVPFKRFLSGLRGIAWTYHRPDKPTGGTIGDADFILYGPGSRCLHIEFKDKDTAISAGQKARHAELAAIGITVHIIRDLNIAEVLVIEWQRQLGPAEPVLSRNGASRLTIRDAGGGQGDFVFDGGKRLRRATIDDLKTLQRP